MVDIHFRTVLPDVEEFDDVGVPDKLENSHLSLNGERHPTEAPIGTGCWVSVINAIQVRQAACLGDVGDALGYDLDGDDLMGNPVASLTDTC